jgi:hypothetical protein
MGVFFFFPFYRSDIQEYIDKQSKILDDILTGYDKRFIPTIPG